MFMCIICTMKAPSLSSLRGEHRQLLESIVGPLIDMTEIKGYQLHNCADCGVLMQSVQNFRQTALNGVRAFKYILTTVDQAAALKLRPKVTLDPITVSEKPGDEIPATKKEFETDPEIVQSDETTIDIELEPVKTEQDPLTELDCVDSKNFPRIQTLFLSGSTGSTGSTDSGFNTGMKMKTGFDTVDSKKNKTLIMNKSVESTGLISAIQTINASANSVTVGKNKTPFMIGSNGKNKAPYMIGSIVTGSTGLISGMKTMNSKIMHILRNPSGSNKMCQLYIKESKSTQIKNKIMANSVIPIQTTKITPCGLKITSVRWAETVDLDLNAISKKQTTINKERDKTKQAANEAEITSKECEIVSIHEGKTTSNPITQDSDSEQTVLPNARKKNVPKKKKRKPSVVKEYPCPYCDRILKGTNYKPHIKRFHYKLKPSPCKECGKVFRNKMVLMEHMKTHELAKPKTIDDVKPELFCVDCSIQFYTRSAFKNHMMTLKHMSKEKYTIECEICKMKCVNKNRLKQHFDVVHLKKKKHKCDKCDKAFSGAFRLRQHIAVDHEKQAKPRPHVCHLCGKTFTSRKNFSEHLLAHEGLRPFQCRLCSATFTYSAALFTHNKLKHLKNKTKCKKKEGEKAGVGEHLESIDGEVKETGEELDKDDFGAGAKEMKETGELENEGEKASEDDTGSIEMLEEWEEDCVLEDSMDVDTVFK